MSVTVCGNDARDVAVKLGLFSSGDIELSFRSADYGRVSIEGFTVTVRYNKFLNREFTKLEPALAYLRKLHNQRLAAQRKKGTE